MDPRAAVVGRKKQIARAGLKACSEVVPRSRRCVQIDVGPRASPRLEWRRRTLAAAVFSCDSHAGPALPRPVSVRKATLLLCRFYSFFRTRPRQLHESTAIGMCNTAAYAVRGISRRSSFVAWRCYCHSQRCTVLCVAAPTRHGGKLLGGLEALTSISRPGSPRHLCGPGG